MSSDAPVRLAVFDCDGTLIDGQASICDAMGHAFAEFGLAAPDPHSVRRAVGLSLPQAIQRLLPDAEPERIHGLVAAYKSAFRAARASGKLSQPMYDGMALLLASLREAGWLLGVATGMSDQGLSHCLATHELTDHFVTLQTSDRHPSKPHPAMLRAALAEAFADAANTVMIGDTAYDMLMARDAGVRGIGVAWGYHTADELRAAGAVFVARNPAELAEYLQR